MVDRRGLISEGDEVELSQLRLIILRLYLKFIFFMFNTKLCACITYQNSYYTKFYMFETF